jgi:hypothetical protein
MFAAAKTGFSLTGVVLEKVVGIWALKGFEKKFSKKV